MHMQRNQQMTVVTVWYVTPLSAPLMDLPEAELPLLRQKRLVLVPGHAWAQIFSLQKSLGQS